MGPKGGHPPFVPSDEQRTTAKVLIGFGMSIEGACTIFPNPYTGRPIDQSTFKTVFAKEMLEASAWIDALLAGTMLGAVRKGNITACIWMTKNRWGWSDGWDRDSRGGGGGVGSKTGKFLIEGGLPPMPIEDSVAPEPLKEAVVEGVDEAAAVIEKIIKPT